MQPLEAVDKDIICPQTKSPYVSANKMQENCLVANIHVPNTKETNLPVFVYVHGGAYCLGYGEMGSPASLVKRRKNFIAVTFNYRLGAHGFLCLGTEDAPGNAGMKDQVALLRWVKKNIASFGGNPDDVTLAGGSAGGSAVDLLMLSDMTEGLYNKVIPESGSGLAAWSVQRDPIEYAIDFARIKNFSNPEDILALAEYYKSESFEELASEGMLLRTDSSFNFTPCIERNVGQEMFLKEAPINILKKGEYRKVPMLNGFANMEGLFAIPYFEERKVKMNERFADYLPSDLQFDSYEERVKVAQIVKEFYFGDKLVSEDTIQGYIDYHSDILFTYGCLRSVGLQVKAVSDSIYLYEYSFYSPHTQNMYPDFMKDIRGADHGQHGTGIYDSDFNFIFHDSEAHQYMKAALQDIWINFITIGKPVPEGSPLPVWQAVGANRSPHMDLGEKIQLKGPLLEARARFWDNIYERYSRTPVAPRPIKMNSEL